MENSELQQILDRHPYIWFRDGFSIESGVPVGFRIPGRKPGQEIRINNYGTVRRPDYRYALSQDGELLCENLHFPSAAEALRHALDYSEQTDRIPSLRRFEWYSGHFAYAVDGLIRIDAIVIDFEPGKF